MKAATISYFIGGIGFVFMGLSIAFVSGISSCYCWRNNISCWGIFNKSGLPGLQKHEETR
jgi:hypothetical protein